MRLPFRKKDRKKAEVPSSYPDEFRSHGVVDPLPARPSWASARCLAQLPPAVLQRIFAFVCPHSRDESYETCEESANDVGCMLCDLRDLSHCAQVSRSWRASAMVVLYVWPTSDRKPCCITNMQRPDTTAFASTRCITASLRPF